MGGRDTEKKRESEKERERFECMGWWEGQRESV